VVSILTVVVHILPADCFSHVSTKILYVYLTCTVLATSPANLELVDWSFWFYILVEREHSEAPRYVIFSTSLLILFRLGTNILYVSLF